MDDKRGEAEESAASIPPEVEKIVEDLSLEAFAKDLAASRWTSGPAIKRAREMGKGDVGQRAEAAWEAAARSGDIEGQFQHGVTCYYEDKRAANLWWTRAAESGHLAAQWWLGLQFLTGDGIERDIGLAGRILTASAEQGNGSAAIVLACINDKTPEWLWRLLVHAVGENMEIGILGLLMSLGDPSDLDRVRFDEACKTGLKIQALRDRAEKDEKNDS